MFVNVQDLDILNVLMEEKSYSQRELAQLCGYSLGTVNRSVKLMMENGYLENGMNVTSKGFALAEKRAPKNAIILAAGFGMRMIPINTEMPKGLMEVKGEKLIDRLILQLREAGISQIYVVVGFMKEHYEYLIDKYGVELIVNPDYVKKNNLHSLAKVLDKLSNSYVLPCDIWCACNPFRRHELYSWYMVNDRMSRAGNVRVNRKKKLVRVLETEPGNNMVGVCYLLEEEALSVRQQIERMCAIEKYDNAFWEEALYRKDRMLVPARVMKANQVVEVNTYEELRELDNGSDQLKSDIIELCAAVLRENVSNITEIEALKKGMTNRSFLFRCGQKRFIMRIPGEGTDKLINRIQESRVYDVIAGKKICDDIIYLNPDNGYKISVYLEGARVCDPQEKRDVNRCMKKLREFHEMGLEVEHKFDIFGQIEFYEALWGEQASAYKDYEETKRNVYSLRAFIEAHAAKMVLAHIDAVPDNFLFVRNEKGEEDIRLIDWEYAGMQDPHVDIAMFCVYAMYDREHVEEAICAYFPEGCSDEVRIKIYCYIAACGLLWSNWCEYKLSLGIAFGEYSLKQYRFAKEYYRIVQPELQKEENQHA